MILEYDFVINDYDKCLYSKIMKKDYVILCLYVDNIFIFGTSLGVIKDIEFEMKDLGETNMILCTKVSKIPNDILCPFLMLLIK